MPTVSAFAPACKNLSPRSAFVLRWLALRDAAAQLRHDAEGVLGTCEAADAIFALERVEELLSDDLPRLVPAA